MAFDEQLANRVREAFTRLPGLAETGLQERRMFGGVCFMVHGHMACGVAGDRLMLRLGNEGATEALREPHTAPMDFTGKPLKSMIYVDPDGLRTERGLAKWVKRATEFAMSEPSRPAKRVPKRKKLPSSRR